MPASYERTHERIIREFIALLKDKPYKKITATELISAAKVNRSTFYRHFETIENILPAVVDEMTRRIIAEPCSPITDAESLERYANEIFCGIDRYKTELFLLAGPNGDFNAAYRIAGAVRRRLSAAANAAWIDDPAVMRCVTMSEPVLSLYLLIGDLKSFFKNKSGKTDHTYDINESLLRNVSRYLALNRGGSADIQYDLVCAYVLLDAKDKHSLRVFSVSDLMAVVGMTRSGFYHYYRSMEDFFDAFEEATVSCAVNWILTFITVGWPDENDLKVFIGNNNVRTGIEKFFLHGRLSAYFPKLFDALIPVLIDKFPGIVTEEKQMSMAYYLTEFAFAVCTYLIGSSDYASLQKTFAHLQGLADN